MRKWLMIGIAVAIVLSLLGWFFIDGGIDGDGEFRRGQSAYDAGDYSRAIEIWEPLAGRGHAKAQYHLSVSYAIGEGVEQDCEAAVKWYRLFAEQADAPAEFLLRYERQFEIGFIESLLLTRCSVNMW